MRETKEKAGRSRAICKRCKGKCCTLKTVVVVLDHEQNERRLSEFKGKYEYDVKVRGGKVPVLKKRKDGSCIYHSRSTGACDIYHRRPAGCRWFFCGRGTKVDQTWKWIRDWFREAKKEKR